MKIDYAQSIKYIMENLDKLNLKRDDLEKLRETLELLEIQVEQQMVQEVLENSEELRQQIEETKKELEERISCLKERAETEKESLYYPEYSPQEQEEGVPIGYQKQVEKNNREKYNKEKENWEKSEKPRILQEIQQLEKMVTILEGYRDSIDDPESFIQQTMTHFFGLDFNTKYQDLMNMCATNMAYGYMSMETERTGQNTPLFSKSDTRSNFTGYVPNPEAISSFLNLIRNPELVEELTEYDKVHKSYSASKKEVDEAQELLEKAEKLREVLNNPELCGEVEQYIEQMMQLVSEKRSIEAQRRKNSLPKKTNAFTRFINRILGKTRKEEDSDRELIGKQYAVEGRMEKLFNSELQKNSPDYRLVHNAYLPKDRTVGYEQYRANEYEEIEWLLKSKVNGEKNGEETTLHQAVVDAIKPEEKVEQAEAKVQNVTQHLSEKEQSLEETYQSLSPEAKRLIDERSTEQGRGTINMHDIKSRFINVDERDRYGVSPFVSSLILEALMKSQDVHTPEDLEKLGIVMSREQITGYRDRANSIVDKSISMLQKIASKGKDMEER